MAYQLVCFSSPKLGSPAIKQTISKWITKAICTSYEASNMLSPLLVRTQFTRCMACSKVLQSGVSLQEMFDEGDWSSPHIYQVL